MADTLTWGSEEKTGGYSTDTYKVNPSALYRRKTFTNKYRYESDKDDGFLFGWSRNDSTLLRTVLDVSANMDTIVTPQGTESREYNSANMPIRIGTLYPVHDGIGNLIHMGTHFYGWTADGLLAWSATGADTVRYRYDAQRRRIATLHGTDTTLIIYSGSRVLQEQKYTATGLAETRTYAYLDYIDDACVLLIEKGPAASVDAPEGLYYLHQGVNHNVELVTDSTGALVERYELNPWGEFTVQANGMNYAQSTIGNNRIFQGRPYDAVSGIYDFRNRWYSPALGRWISRDPLGPTANMFGNVYLGFDGNPMQYTDPYGLATYVKRYSIQLKDVLGFSLASGSPGAISFTATISTSCGNTSSVSISDVSSPTYEESYITGASFGDIPLKTFKIPVDFDAFRRSTWTVQHESYTISKLCRDGKSIKSQSVNIHFKAERFTTAWVRFDLNKNINIPFGFSTKADNDMWDRITEDCGGCCEDKM